MSTAHFQPLELCRITGGSWKNGVVPDTKRLSISTDTRIDNSGKIFFALAGERFDAHDFLPQASASGCECCCVEYSKSDLVPAGLPALLVDNTLLAMQRCAAYHRMRFPDLTVFGVTGSVGKTSVKEMMKAICSHAAGADAVLSTLGNTNNQIGVPQNLLNLTSAHRYAVLEAGTSSPGEIAPLADMIRPDGAIINSIAPCHLENLIDLDGVATEKSTIFNALPDGGVAVYPAETVGKKILCAAAEKHRHCTFGLDGKGDISARFISGDLEGSSFELTFPGGSKHVVNWHLTGIHNALNAAGCAALAFSCGISPEMIAQALPMTTLPGMRMKKTVINGITYYNDAYNANPASMHASVKLLASSAPSVNNRLFLMLGGMRELGKISQNAHKELLDFIALELPQAYVLTVGDEFSGLSPHHFATPEAAGQHLSAVLLPGDIVFAKGSRGNAVEKCLPPEAR